MSKSSKALLSKFFFYDRGVFLSNQISPFKVLLLQWRGGLWASAQRTPPPIVKGELWKVAQRKPPHSHRKRRTLETWRSEHGSCTSEDYAEYVGVPSRWVHRNKWQFPVTVDLPRSCMSRTTLQKSHLMMDIYWIIAELFGWMFNCFSRTLKIEIRQPEQLLEDRTKHRQKESFHMRFSFCSGLDKFGKSNKKMRWSARDHITAWRDMMFFL